MRIIYIKRSSPIVIKSLSLMWYTRNILIEHVHMEWAFQIRKEFTLLYQRRLSCWKNRALCMGRRQRREQMEVKLEQKTRSGLDSQILHKRTPFASTCRFFFLETKAKLISNILLPTHKQSMSSMPTEEHVLFCFVFNLLGFLITNTFYKNNCNFPNY